MEDSLLQYLCCYNHPINNHPIDNQPIENNPIENHPIDLRLDELSNLQAVHMDH